MINNIIDNIKNENKSSQWEAVQYLKIMNTVLNEFEKDSFKANFDDLADALKTKINELKTKSSDFESRIELNKELLSEEKIINSNFEKLNSKIDLLNRLTNQKDFLNKNNIVTIEEDINNEESNIIAIKTKYNEILKNLNTFLQEEVTSLDKQLDANIVVASNNLEMLENQHKGHLQKMEITTIGTKIGSFKNEIENLVSDYNIRVEKIKGIKEDLEEIQEKHSKIMEVFSLHNIENNNVFGELQKREGVLKHVQQIGEEIKEKLATYDNEIKTLVAQRDKLPLYELSEMKKYD